MLIQKSRILLLAGAVLLCVAFGLSVAQDRRGGKEQVKCMARFIVVDLQQRGPNGIGVPLYQGSLLFSAEQDGGQQTVSESEAPDEEKLRHSSSIKVLNDGFPLKAKVAYQFDRGESRRISIAAEELVFEHKNSSMVVHGEGGRYLLVVVLIPK